MVEVTQELLPCPFCGHPPLVGPTLDDMFVAMCENDRCCRFDNYWPTKAEAIAAWNTRHQPQPSAEQADPVAWIDADGNLHKQPREPFLFLEDEDEPNRGRAAPWYGTDLASACTAAIEMAGRYNTKYRLVGYFKGELASYQKIFERYGPRDVGGTFSCPICGKDTPHKHTKVEVQDFREAVDFRYARSQEFWENVEATVAELSAKYPERQPLYAHQPQPSAEQATVDRIVADITKKARNTMIAELAGLPMESQYRAGIKWCGEHIIDAIQRGDWK